MLDNKSGNSSTQEVDGVVADVWLDRRCGKGVRRWRFFLPIRHSKCEIYGGAARRVNYMLKSIYYLRKYGYLLSPKSAKNKNHKYKSNRFVRKGIDIIRETFRQVVILDTKIGNRILSLLR
jgi:hypothetical protein